LASNPNTPEPILYEIYESSAQWQPGMAVRALARNPSLALNLVDAIIRDRDTPSLQELLRNPVIGCEQLHAIVDQLALQGASRA
jgi:hypothetical protein